MIAMNMISTYDEYNRDRIAHATGYPLTARSVRHAMLRALSMLGLGLGGVAALEDDEVFGERPIPLCEMPQLPPSLCIRYPLQPFDKYQSASLAQALLTPSVRSGTCRPRGRR